MLAQVYHMAPYVWMEDDMNLRRADWIMDNYTNSWIL